MNHTPDKAKVLYDRLDSLLVLKNEARQKLALVARECVDIEAYARGLVGVPSELAKAMADDFDIYSGSYLDLAREVENINKVIDTFENLP